MFPDDLNIEEMFVEVDDQKGFKFKGDTVPARFITGVAGSGKTYQIRKKIEENPKYAILAATTGIAAINLGAGVTTINSLLAYYDEESLKENYYNGTLVKRLKRVSEEGFQNIAIDEVSMLGGGSLDIIYNGLEEHNSLENTNELGLVLTGDFCFGFGTKVMMSDGTVRAVEDVETGEFVMGPDSSPRKVIRTTQGKDFLYQIEQTNGITYVVNSKHQLVLKRSGKGENTTDGYIRYPTYGDRVLMTAPDLIRHGKKFRQCFVGYKSGVVEFPWKSVPVAPYFLGLWLGDGTSAASAITTIDPEVIAYCEKYALKQDLACTYKRKPTTKAVTIHLSNGEKGNKPNVLLAKLRSLGVINNKHIPQLYISNSIHTRLELLAGLLDSDGSWGCNRYTVTFTKKGLAEQTKFLADTLGFRTKISQLSNGYYANGKNGGAWVVTIGGDTWRIPCRIERKISKVRNLGRSRTTSTLKVKSLGVGKYAGFEVEGVDALFLLEDGTVVHNCQLPPVKAKWAFEAECWPKFQSNTEKLTKIWRQSDGKFLEALNYFRSGEGTKAMVAMMESGVSLKGAIDYEFDGTTIMPKNDAVDNFNNMRLAQLTGKPFQLKSFRWADDRFKNVLKQWANVPEVSTYKIGALVMILSNSTPDFTYVNGDLATIEEFDSMTKELVLKLKRNNSIVRIKPLLRQQHDKETPLEFRPKKSKTINEEGVVEEREVFPSWPTSREQAFKDSGGLSRVYYDEDKGKWVIGEIYYYPIRLGWASTVHRTQGLTLDRIQVDIRDNFFSAPGMLYVAFSRARTPQGISIVGKPELMKRCKIDPKIKEWL